MYNGRLIDISSKEIIATDRNPKYFPFIKCFNNDNNKYYLLTYIVTYLLTGLLTYRLTDLLIYLLTPLRRVFLEKITGSQLVKKFP
jgi:hypothetical protein